MSVLETSSLSFEEKLMYSPPIEEVLKVLRNGLKTNFENVFVEYVDCPNLMKAPYHLADSGLNGSPTILEIGGVPYLLPTVDQSKLYDIVEVCNKTVEEKNVNKYFTFGAAAGPWPYVNRNCEGIFNFKVENNSVSSESHLAYVGENKKCVLQKIPDHVTSLAVLGNLFLSEGKPGKVINIKCSKRTGSDNFVSSIRKTLAKYYTETDKTVGLGGVFILKKGSAKIHVMRDFCKTPIHTDEELNNWLKYFSMDAVLIALGTMVTNDAGLDLRVQHFHTFSKHGNGGHYHIDTTPEIVEYEGFFTLGEKIVRVDRPLETHLFGRD